MEFLPGNIELSSNPFEKGLWDLLVSSFSEDAGILGYKIPALGNKETIDIPSFTMRSVKYGILVFDVVGDHIKAMDEEGRFWIKDDNDDITSRDLLVANYCRDIRNKLSKSTKLYDYKEERFTVPNLVKSILFFQNNTEEEIVSIEKKYGKLGSFYITKNKQEYSFKEFILKSVREDISQELISEINSILDGTSIFNKGRKRIIEESPSRNDLIKKSLVQTFILDSTQRSVALQVPNGPQRIRGLAGTGKTVILSMKAALTHISNRDKDFNILFVFNTQSMYNHIIENIEKYTIEESSSAPNWDKLNVLHAWGGNKKEGLYSFLCRQYSLVPKTYYEARGNSNPYQFIYSDFLAKTKDIIKPIYDMVLIDEAQDFPPAFFETIFYITKEPKRVIWAYDEFQSLSELQVAEPTDLFGKNKKGDPNIPNEKLIGEFEGGIKRDFMLPNSYRNPRKVLMYAHGLGLGLYSENAKLPMKDKISWEARGYKIIEPTNKVEFSENDQIIVERPEEYSKNILETLISENTTFKTENIITYKHHSTIKDELNYVIKWIEQLITRDKIEPEEIIVISLDKTNAENHFNYIRSELNANEIQCITPGFIEKSDKFKEKGRVTLTTPFRAKGNESNIVFVINTQHVINDKTLQDRNALFVSITRCRGWCFVSGNGDSSLKLEKEINEIEKNYPRFKFIFPKKSDYQRRLKIISDVDKNLSKAEKKVEEILKQDSYLALLIEKAKDNPDLLKKIKEMLGNDK
ncbi:MAG: ATP-binding domain-containing protein [Breznakibacter sp.]